MLPSVKDPIHRCIPQLLLLFVYSKYPADMSMHQAQCVHASLPADVSTYHAQHADAELVRSVS